MRSIGDAHVSITRQDGGAQVAALRDAGCSAVFNETFSNHTSDSARTGPQKTLGKLQAGDELVQVQLNRLGRTQGEVINLLMICRPAASTCLTLDGLFHTRVHGEVALLGVSLLSGLAEVEHCFDSNGGCRCRDHPRRGHRSLP